ncbi:MAG TPA: histidine phosphatase family protein [Bacteroidia bacterium]|nr:histidine phosphatase family protein [Bacteroidia bacterium]MBP7715060.1 histidine phosphatase family protein [Bacteroidia bacterium]MBP8669550.1 histidine phosphatase family protein [Bacteroidia bacterium]HOZ81719.1 histidine phosphatase family protein [Bacteroidia bacterium]HOZ90040.1 histidine phosphatase family protein [Bacteroidia bacterium]
MPKTIFLIRHSKATREYSQINDSDRPLTEKGCHDTEKMSLILKDHINSVDLILTSTAVRAYASALIYSKHLGYHPNNIQLEKNLYMTGSKDMLAILKSLDDQINSVALIAHNPGLERLVKFLTGTESLHFSTSGLAMIESKIDAWNELNAGNCNLLSYRHPKETIYN